MAVRGRGTLQVRESPNPFFCTTQSDIGTNLTKYKRSFEGPPCYKINIEKTESQKRAHFPFLYRRSSDDIGKGIPPSGSKLAEIMDHFESPSQQANIRAMGLKPVLVRPEDEEAKYVWTKDKDLFLIDRERYLNAYDHNPKRQNPLYTTTQNDIGIKGPSKATVVTQRRSRCQGFSNSFNGVRVKDQSLNCYLTRSKVHKELDPHFI